MKREIRDRRRNLLRKSIEMREILISKEADKTRTLMTDQNEAFKKFKFYDGIIKAMERAEEHEKFNGRRFK